ncbi:spore coat protein [Caldibacillus lycopersici]|uniref:Spore coat protein n=1 Tax=Perspicuibacillus lycopersici TaxID=1325689 RepID=A0AAE3LTX9_9BACI|nr:spore coat protein [Perspicuibacillus lycopersici]MCU9614698.1 spore coat protein [Perspicuibacillus lycopersici]
MNQETYRAKVDNSHDRKPSWSALDPTSEHPLSSIFNNDDDQTAVQTVKELQVSEEVIHIRDSADVSVNTTDNKAALSLVASLNATISLILNISIASSSDVDEVTQSLYQATGIRQITKQKTVVENSRGVSVETTDTQLALNIQLLLQILLALLINLDIL